MPDSSRALLDDRGVVAVSGPDAASFLQGILTNDIESAGPGQAVFAALLTPQGKILFDFLIYHSEDGYMLDCAAAKAAELAKRLSFYKLRAKVTVEDVSEASQVWAAWGEGASASLGERAFADPRHPALGLRAIVSRDGDGLSVSVGREAYDTHRIGLCIPEGGKDYAFGDTFPHEACLDLLNGVDFKKGCFVGQEVVSRMQHRGTARMRVVQVEGDAGLEAGSGITADGFAIGKLGSVSGQKGIALVRLDRAADAMAKGETIAAAGGAPVRLSVPEWAGYAFEAPAGAHV